MADDNDQQQQDKAPDQGDQFAPITSQEDFDRRLSDRLRRERDKIRGEFADYADIKAKADAHDKAMADAMTEQERAVQAARQEGETAAAQAANNRLVNAEARALAAQAGFRSLADVSLLDLSGITVADNGDVDSDAIKAKLKELSDAEPWRIDDGKKPAPKPDKTQGRDKSDAKPSVAAGRDLYAERRGKKTA